MLSFMCEIEWPQNIKQIENILSSLTGHSSKEYAIVYGHSTRSAIEIKMNIANSRYAID